MECVNNGISFNHMEFIPVNFDKINVNLSPKIKYWLFFNTCEIKNKTKEFTLRKIFLYFYFIFIILLFYNDYQDVYRCTELVNGKVHGISRNRSCGYWKPSSSCFGDWTKTYARIARSLIYWYITLPLPNFNIYQQLLDAREIRS